MSSTMASSILRKFSACRCSLVENGIALSLGDALDQVRNLRPEQLLDALDRGERVLDHVVEQARDDRRRVQAEVGERYATSSGCTR